jgi:large subunit ribosomal protein L9
MVEVILLERVEKLGVLGQVVNVRPGFARNFLLPQKKALRATKANLALFEERRAQLEATNLARRGEAELVAGRMAGLAVAIIRQAGESGLLYGSVSARDIADAVTAAGFTVERRQVALDHPIKTLGLHTVKLGLHPEVSVGVVVNVAQSQDEAAVQASGRDPRAEAALLEAQDAAAEAEHEAGEETDI